MHLREDFLTLMLSGHRRSVRQLHTIELRPTIPFRHSSLLIFPVPLERSAPLRPATRHFEFFFATTLTSLWRPLLPKLAAIRGSIEFFAASRCKNRITDTVDVRQRRNLTPSMAAEQARKTSHQNTVSWPTAMWMLSWSKNHVQFLFSDAYMMLVWTCIAPFILMSFAPLRQCCFIFFLSCGSVHTANLDIAFL